MGVDNYACLFFGLRNREIDFDQIPGFEWGEDESTEDAIDRLSQEYNLNLTCQRNNNDDLYIGFTLARTDSYDMCEVEVFDLERIRQDFYRLFSRSPKLWLIEQQD